MKYTGTISRGVKAPIIRKGDDIAKVVCDSLENLTNLDGVVLNDGDIICVTESVVAIAQNNFATISQIANDVRSKFSKGVVGLVFPILSRNRFSLLLEAINQGVDSLVIQLSYPKDEVGNSIIKEEELIENKVNPYNDVFTKDEFKKIFKDTKHLYTGVDYLDLYQNLINKDSKIILANDPREILKYTDQILVANVHDRLKTKELLLKNGAKKVLLLDDFLKTPQDGSGYNEEYGLLGANLATTDSVKLFPRNSMEVVKEIQKQIKNRLNVQMEVMIYGDGAFKDPKGKIWELCDPVVSPGFTSGLLGTPNELKLKYLANTAKDEASLKKLIEEKSTNLVGKNESLGTTPRQIVDLLGSLADLVSGSGDKGTPFVLIQNYFSNYAK